jgi:hypothetical protein
MRKKTSFSSNCKVNKSNKIQNYINDEPSIIAQRSDINSSLLNFSLGIDKYHTGQISTNNNNNTNNKILDQKTDVVIEKKSFCKTSSGPVSYNLLNYNEYDEVESSNYIKASTTATVVTHKINKKERCSLFKEKFSKCFCLKLKQFFNEINFNYVINILLLLLIIYNYIQTYYLKNDICELQKKLEEAPIPFNSNFGLAESNERKDYLYRIQKV